MFSAALPERLNAATIFVDVHLSEGRADKAAILCGDQAITYRQLQDGVNRFGNVLLELEVRIEERVAILLPDSPQWAYAFFGSMKIGAVAVPLNTLLTSKDYEYLLNDSRARVLVVHESLLGQILPIRENLRYMQHLVTTGAKGPRVLHLDELMEQASSSLAPADTSRDDAAF